MSVHADPDTHGIRFGAVLATIDRMAGDCVLWVRTPTGRTRRIRLHSLDEIQGSLGAHQANASDPVSADMTRALRFAAQCLSSKGKSR